MKMLKINSPAIILKLLKSGTISCVTKQDWAVNRIVPEFIDPKKFKGQLGTGEKLLHLGIGNGDCYKFFDHQCNISQSSISDKLYFDLDEIISLYLSKCNISSKGKILLSRLMRNEYLIAISYNDLYARNKSLYFDKDVKIIQMLHANYDSTKSYSYNVLLLLLKLLNEEPQILAPQAHKMRIVTTMGKRIITHEISKSEVYNFVTNLTGVISLNEVSTYLFQRFGKMENIYISDFNTASFESSVLFDYIIATRSDAFLQERYLSFLLKILEHLGQHGFYISDGILSCYDYKICYRELINFAESIGRNRIYIVQSYTKSQDVPLKDISGILITGINADIEKIYPYVSKERILPFECVFSNDFFLRQCVWSDVVTWANENKVDLESIEFEKLNLFIDQMVLKFSVSKVVFSGQDSQVFEYLLK